MSLSYRLMAQSGYPWTLDLHVLYDLSAEGMTVTQTATNLSTGRRRSRRERIPICASGPAPVDGWELTLPASRRLLADERLIPVGEEEVTDTVYDFRVARPLRDLRLDDGFGDLARDEAGLPPPSSRDPATGLGAALWCRPAPSL